MVSAQDFLQDDRTLEAFLRSSEFEQYYLSSPQDAVIVTDHEGGVRYHSPAAQQLIGYRSEKIQGRPLHQIFRLIDEASNEPVDDPVSKCLQLKTIVGMGNQDALVDGAGNVVPVAGTAKPIRGNAGEIIGVILIFRDVTPTRIMMRRISYQAEYKNDAYAVAAATTKKYVWT